MRAPRFQTRLSLAVSLLLGATVAVMTFIVMSLGLAEMGLNFHKAGADSTVMANRTIEYGLSVPGLAMDRIKEQLLVSALITSELVPLAEKPEPATPEQIKTALNRVVERSKGYKGYALVDEFWVTDSDGKAYINTQGQDFVFSPDPNTQPQASRFWPLLNPYAKPIVSDLAPRDIDQKPFLYVGVPGADKPRIIQVGVGEEHVNALQADFRVQKIVDQVMSNRSFEKILVVSADGKVEARAEREDEETCGLPDEPAVEFCRAFLASPTAVRFDMKPFGDDVGVVTRLHAPDAATPSVLFIQHHMAQERAVMRKHILFSVLLGITMLVVSVAVCLFLCRGLYKPIGVLATGVEAFAKGDFQHRVELPPGDEIGELANAFNGMADSMSGYIEQLEYETQRRERLESEFRIAGEVQRSLLPMMPPTVPGLELLGWSMPAKEVGGDFYDFLELDNDRFLVIIGDATGKGLSAALHVTECWSVLRTLAEQIDSPGELLYRTNNAMYSRFGATNRFVTIFCMMVDLKHGFLKYSNGGHNPPLLAGADARRVLRLSSEGGLPLGIVENTEYEETDVLLRPFDTVLLYSDGVTEAHSPGDGLYGEERLRDVLVDARELALTGVVASICEDLVSHMLDRDIVDDMTMVCLRYKPQDMVETRLAERQRQRAAAPRPAGFEEAPV